MIITVVGIDYNHHCKYQFGEYVQSHKEHNSTMAPRMIGVLALLPTRNAQGSFQFFSLSTRRVLTQNHTTALPMLKDVIAQVHRIARHQKAHPGMVFEDRNHAPLDKYEDGEANSDDNDNCVPGDNDDEYSDDEDSHANDHENNVGQDVHVANIAGVNPKNISLEDNGTDNNTHHSYEDFNNGNNNKNVNFKDNHEEGNINQEEDYIN